MLRLYQRSACYRRTLCPWCQSMQPKIAFHHKVARSSIIHSGRYSEILQGNSTLQCTKLRPFCSNVIEGNLLSEEKSRRNVVLKHKYIHNDYSDANDQTEDSQEIASIKSAMETTPPQEQALSKTSEGINSDKDSGSSNLSELNTGQETVASNSPIVGASIGNQSSEVEGPSALLSQDESADSLSPHNEMPDELDISSLRPVIPARAYNLAAYVNDSETLTNLVKLGVNLAKVQKDKDMASFLARQDFQRDVQPYLLFLLNAGVSGADLGSVITKNPQVLREPMEDLEVKVNYLEFKKFSKEAIGRIFSRAPELLTLGTVHLDRQLGFLQKQFRLKGHEVRTLVAKYPPITLIEEHTISVNTLMFQDYMGFSELERKQILMAKPRLYGKTREYMIERFEYLTTDMELTREQILSWPNILGIRLHITRQRHQFLKSMGRDQFDPKKENYVSLEALAITPEHVFCRDIAKCDISVYHSFLKTL